MSSVQRLREPRRKKIRNGWVVHVYQPQGGGVLYVPIIPAWGAAGLKRALDGLTSVSGELGPEPGVEPG